MDPLSLLVIAASFGAKYLANKQAQDRQQSLANAMRNYQQIKARQTEQAINNLVSEQTPQNRQADMAKAIADRSTTANDLVQQVASSNPAPIAGKLSGDYKKSQARTADTVAQRTKRAIQQLATMGAPGDVGVQSGIRYGRVAGNVDANNSAINRVGQAYSTDINNVRPDPLLSTLGDVGLAVGAGMGGAAAGGATATAAGDLGGIGGMAGADAAGKLALPWYSRLKQGFSLWGTR